MNSVSHRMLIDSDNESSDIDKDKSKNRATHMSAVTDVCVASSGENVSSNFPQIRSMALNDNKAGMEGLDREKINKIIYEASKGSKFYENERKKEEALNLKIKEQQTLIAGMSASQLMYGLNQADQLLTELEESRDLSHTIVHVDMDAFYAAVEMRDNPSLKDKPMAVGSMSMLSTSNYIARRFGIRAAMPGFIGRKLCPELEIVPPNFDKYKAVSETVQQIFDLYDPNFVSVSLDEAYLDFTEHLRNRLNSPPSSRTFLLRAQSDPSLCTCDLNLVLKPHLSEVDLYSHLKDETMKGSTDFSKLSYHSCISNDQLKVCQSCKRPFPPFTVKVYGVSVEEAVMEMRNRIEQRTKLTASAGIAPNTMLAKICSDKKKPNGQFQVESTKRQIEDFISRLSVRKISGIGKVTEKLLEALGIVTCHDLYEQRAKLYHAFSPKSFHYFMSIALGIGSSTVERDGERKSMSTEQTFSQGVYAAELLHKCQELCLYLAKDLKSEKLMGKTFTLKMKTETFEVKTRASTLSHYTNDKEIMFQAAKQLLEREIQAVKPGCLCLRLLGVRMSKLVSQVVSSTSVASYFQTHSKEVNPHLKNTVAKDVSLKRENYPDRSAPSENKFLPAMFSSCSTHDANITSPSSGIEQIKKGDEDEDDNEDYKCIWTDIESNKDTTLSNTTSVTTETSKSKPNTNSKTNKQEKIVNFLCTKNDDHQLAVIDICSPSQPMVCRRSGTEVELDNKKSLFSLVDTSLNHLSSLSQTSSTTSTSFTVGIQQDIVSSPFNKFGLSESTTASSLDSSGMVLCPVCGQQKYQWPLDQLNTHLDLCLSRSAVKDVLSDLHQHSSHSRKRAQQDEVAKQTVNKKTKTQHTLAAFFKK